MRCLHVSLLYLKFHQDWSVQLICSLLFVKTVVRTLTPIQIQAMSSCKLTTNIISEKYLHPNSTILHVNCSYIFYHSDLDPTGPKYNPKLGHLQASYKLFHSRQDTICLTTPKIPHVITRIFNLIKNLVKITSFI